MRLLPDGVEAVGVAVEDLQLLVVGVGRGTGSDERVGVALIRGGKIGALGLDDAARLTRELADEEELALLVGKGGRLANSNAISA